MRRISDDWQFVNDAERLGRMFPRGAGERVQTMISFAFPAFFWFLFVSFVRLVANPL